MSSLKIFVFNPLQVNTYLIYDKSGSCIIVDPACYSIQEEKMLENFITENNLTPRKIIYTHLHVDHILGNNFIQNKWKIPYLCHQEGKLFRETAHEFGSVMGLKIDNMPEPDEFLSHGDIISINDIKLKILYTPGHADGSICIVNNDDKYVITGDVLFNSSIGRTDLPTGNFDKLIGNINEHLLTLPEDYIVYPGHGPSSTIGYEKVNNPFL